MGTTLEQYLKTQNDGTDLEIRVVKYSHSGVGFHIHPANVVGESLDFVVYDNDLDLVNSKPSASLGTDSSPPIAHVLQFFEFDHLPPHLAAISRPFSRLAQLVAAGSSNPETTVALRKLLEAKDAAVRAVLAESD